MPASPDVLNRLEEIEQEFLSLPEEQDSFAVECSRFWWLLRLTRALLESQGELIAALRFKSDRCEMCASIIARAEKVRKGEV